MNAAARAAYLTGALALAAGLGFAQIERLDLAKMVQQADQAVHGRIVKTEVIRIDHPLDGPELFYTHLWVEGSSLYTGDKLTHRVTFPGGFISPAEGVHNSEAPSVDETRVGTEVIVFSKFSSNLGGDLEGNGLYASRGGMYRVAATRNGPVALGKGNGYAISKNIKVAGLGARIAKLR